MPLSEFSAPSLQLPAKENSGRRRSQPSVTIQHESLPGVMSVSLIHLEQPSAEPVFALTQAQARLRQMVLDSVQSIHSKRNYAKALDDLFAFCASRPLSRELLMEYRTTMEHLSPSTINVRMSAIRKLGGVTAEFSLCNTTCSSMTNIQTI
jgi:hypothetical protein